MWVYLNFLLGKNCLHESERDTYSQKSDHFSKEQRICMDFKLYRKLSDVLHIYPLPLPTLGVFLSTPSPSFSPFSFYLYRSYFFHPSIPFTPIPSSFFNLLTSLLLSLFFFLTSLPLFSVAKKKSVGFLLVHVRL